MIWPKIRLGDVLRRSANSILLQADMEYREITVKLWGKGVILRGITTGAGIAGARRFIAHKGQFILSRIDARNGANGLVPEELEGAVVTNDFPLFDLDHKRIDSGFLGWLGRTNGFVELCLRASEGTTNRVRMQEDKFLNLEIPVPPLDEQRRVVARIEEVLGKVYEARVLQQESNQETSALWNASLREIFLGCDTDKVKLESACSEIVDNLHSNPRYADTGVPCVRSPDVGWGTLYLESALRTDEEEFRNRTIRGVPQANDIVFVREGGGTGKCALVLPNQKFSLGQRVMMLRPNPKVVVPKFLLYQLLSPLVQEDQIQPLSKGSASPHLNIGALRKFSLCLPSLRRQQAIVSELDSLRAQLDEIRGLQSGSRAESDALLPAILDRAFSGQL